MVTFPHEFRLLGISPLYVSAGAAPTLFALSIGTARHSDWTRWTDRTSKSGMNHRRSIVRFLDAQTSTIRIYNYIRRRTNLAASETAERQEISSLFF